MSAASEQAKALGLVYGGFSAWLNPKTRKKVAQTIEGKLVKTGGEEETSTDLGKINIFRVDLPTIQKGDDSKKYTTTYGEIIKYIVRKGDAPLTVLVPMNSQREVAEYLHNELNLSSGVKLTGISNVNPNEIHAYVKEKIEEGYTNIQYFDTSELNINAVESLTAPYNKRDIIIKTHPLKGIDRTEP